MLTHINAFVSIARRCLKNLVWIYFMSFLCRITSKKWRPTMQKKRCLSLISGVSSNLGKNTLNDAGTEKKLVILKKAGNGHQNNVEEVEENFWEELLYWLPNILVIFIMLPIYLTDFNMVFNTLWSTLIKRCAKEVVWRWKKYTFLNPFDNFVLMIFLVH